MSSVCPATTIPATEIITTRNPSASRIVVGISVLLRPTLSRRQSPNKNNESQRAKDQRDFSESYVRQIRFSVRNIVKRYVLSGHKIASCNKLPMHRVFRVILKGLAVPLAEASVFIGEFLLVLLVDRGFAGARGIGRRIDGVPASGRVALYRLVPSTGMDALPKQVKHNDKKEQANQEYVHNNTKNQSDTSNE
ncbi:hypothetical protein [Ruegeria meonggei]|uniref:hypothetical protein n=1 Tax=Ruegeria meonggei TaxID=1446476 RepID=UPI00366ED651